MSIFPTHLLGLATVLTAQIHAADPRPPPLLVVELGKFETSWEFLPGTNSVVPITDYKPEFEANCTASYPVKWNLTGHIVPFDVVKIQPARRQMESSSLGNVVSTYIIKIFIFFEDTSSSSLSVECQGAEEGNSEHKSDVHVFVADATNPLVLGGQNLNLTDIMVLPCATTNPMLPVELQMRTDPASPAVAVDPSLYTYDPFIGFTLQDPTAGHYICRTTLDSVNVQLSFLEEEPILHINPNTLKVQAFTDEEIVINCTTTAAAASLSPPLTIWLFSNFTFEYIVNETFTKVLRFKSSSPETGTFSCSASNHVHSWSLEFIDPPTLFLDNFEGEVDCLTNHPSKSAATVRCKDLNECQFLSRCFNDVENCNQNKVKHFQSVEEKRCWIPKLDSGATCTSVPYAHLNGLAQCVLGGLRRTWEFFVSLGFRRYSNWRDAPLQEILRMDEVDPVLYTDFNSTFFCEATSFLFADSLLFSMEYQNGTVVNITSEGVVRNPEIEDVRKIDEFNVLGILDIQLPLDAVGVYCHAPWSNSSEFMSVKRSFLVKELELPKMLHTKTNYELTIGEENQRLVCYADGEPLPTYHWFKDDKPIDFTNKLEYTLSVGSNGESLLEFLQVSAEDAGNYLCIAVNRVGNDSSTFIMTTQEPSSKSAIVTIFVSLAGLLCIVFLAFFILLKKYKRTQMLLRQLTKEEVDDFVNGKPEFLTSGHNSMDYVDFCPYDKSFEVSMDDLDLDASNYLGAGEYAFVVKGIIKSRNFPVAVKIARPVADVMYFKSLLSELKIMIYIGQHTNVVSLIGAVTSNIQNRSLHILVEFCHLGSLESYLRKNKKEFHNYFPTQEKTEAQNYQNVIHSSSTMSTIDLMLWAHQIAKGMAYLADKSVVHADLATRNVLLTEDKVAKVSDFGLSKKLYESGNYVKKTKVPLPWRWMASESLSTLTFSTQSDVWSYGMTLWEIFTLGDIPFPNEAWSTEFIARIQSGMRMGKPKFSSLEIYSQMNACWDENPKARPSFQEQVKYFFGQSQKLLAQRGTQEESLYENFSNRE